MDVKEKIKSYFFILRPINLGLVLLTLIFLRYFYLIPELKGSGYKLLPTTNYILGCLSIVLSMAGGNVINDIFDYKADLINKPERVFIQKKIKKSNALIYYVSLSILSLVLAQIVNFKFLIIVLSANLLLLLYSLLLKRIAIIGNLLVAALSASIPLLVIWLDVQYIFSLNNDPRIFYFYQFAIIFSILIFLGTMAREIIKDIQDINGDKLLKSKSLPIIIGSLYSKYVSIFFIFILCGFILIYPPITSNDFSFFYFLILVVIPLIVSVLKLRKANIKTDYSKASNLIKVTMFFTILFIAINGLLLYDIF